MELQIFPFLYIEALFILHLFPTKSLEFIFCLPFTSLQVMSVVLTEVIVLKIEGCSPPKKSSIVGLSKLINIRT